MRTISLGVVVALVVGSLIGGCAADVAPPPGEAATVVETPAATSTVKGDGASSATAFGRNSTLVLRAYRLLGSLFYKANHGGTKTLNISCANGVFTTTNPDADVKRLVDIFNAFDNTYSQRTQLCATLSSTQNAFAAGANEMTNPKDVYVNSATLGLALPNEQGAPPAGAWVTDYDTGKTYKTARNELRWRFKGALWQSSGSVMQEKLGVIANNLSLGGDWGEDVRNFMAPSTYPTCNCSDGYNYTTFDPPNDGTTPPTVPQSFAGAGIAQVAVNGMGCMPNGAVIGQACVLAPFIAGYPNYVLTPQVDATGVTWPAYSTASSAKCASGMKCIMK